ncbi:MAG: DUF58 domain-containing protein [Armatimonadota bacterium]|jgi:uncharacterized protein (DUF58 family)
MIPKELLRKIRRIEIHTSRLVNEQFAGQYHSVFRGRGMEFVEVREYQLGDDVRTIDWNVTARMRRPYVKRFTEERELTVVLAVDLSGSTQFGTVEQLKAETAAEICALLAFSAIKNNDKVGLVIFTDEIELFIPPRKGRTHVLRLIREVLYFRPGRRGTDIAGALEYLGRVVRKRSVVFVVSDFRAGEYEKPLRIASRRHDVVAIVLTDPRELQMPSIGLVEFEDAETGERRLVDTGSGRVRGAFAEAAAGERETQRDTLTDAQVECIDIDCGTPYVEPLLRFFAERARRLRR